MSLLPDAWKSQSGFKTDHTYISQQKGIWGDKTTKSHRSSSVMDNELVRRTEGITTAFGSVLRNDPAVLAIEMVNRAINQWPAAKRALLTPRNKWLLISRVENQLRNRMVCA